MQTHQIVPSLSHPGSQSPPNHFDILRPENASFWTSEWKVWTPVFFSHRWPVPQLRTGWWPWWPQEILAAPQLRRLGQLQKWRGSPEGGALSRAWPSLSRERLQASGLPLPTQERGAWLRGAAWWRLGKRSIGEARTPRNSGIKWNRIREICQPTCSLKANSLRISWALGPSHFCVSTTPWRFGPHLI